MITTIGLVAAICSTVSFLPQVIRAWKTKKTKDLSLMMYIIVTAGALLWTTYGFLKGDMIIFGTNTLIFSLAFIILCLKLKNG